MQKQAEISVEEERFKRGQQTRALARLLVKAHRARQRAEPEFVSLPKREVPDSYVWERGFLGFLRKRATVNTKMRHLPKAVGEK